jgi:acyl carrier protein
VLVFLHAERPDVNYTLVAVDFLPDRAIQSALARLSFQLASGKLAPLPQVVHSLSATQAALRQMSQARHVGKIVVRVPMQQPGAASAGAASGMALVTGGLGTLGSLTAAWLATNTKLHVHATGRTGRFGSSSSGGSPLSLLMSGRFTGLVSLTSADAACAEDAALLTSGAEIVGLMHASGVLADATLRNQTLGGIRTVFAPKVSALQQLGSILGKQAGSFQVLFSSVASLLGSAGQSNYSAANAMLDSIATAAQSQVIVAAFLFECWRCEKYFPAINPHACPRARLLDLQGFSNVSIQWGAWAGSGMASQDPATLRAVERLGMGMVEPSEGMAALRLSLGLQSHPSMGTSVVAAVPFNWRRIARLAQKAGAAMPLYADGLSGVEPGPASPQISRRPTRVHGLPAAALDPAKMKASVLAEAQSVLQSVLGSDVPANEPLMAAGLDSLSSIEFKNGLEGRLSLALPATLVFDYPTLDTMAAFISKQMVAAAGTAGRGRGMGPAVVHPPVPNAAAAIIADAEAALAREAVLAEVQAVVGEVLGVSVGAGGLDLEQPLMAAGLDSLGAVELKNALQVDHGRRRRGGGGR